jgi:hypothetical protein
LNVPYVNIHGDSPDEGFPAFMDSPRYATGYTTLFNIPGTVAETHMLKPYQDRVKATYEYMRHSINFVDENYKEISKKMMEELTNYLPNKKYTIRWKRLSGKDFTLQEAALVLVESYHISQEQAERDVVIWADALKKCSALLD